MSFSSLVSSTATVHKFAVGEGPTQEELEKCLELCLWAPNHRKTHPWKIIQASAATRIKIAEHASLLKQKDGSSVEECEAQYQKNLEAKELIIFVQQCLPEDSFREREDYATLSCSIQLLALSLREIGYGYKWSTGKLSQSAEAAKIFCIDPGEEIIGFIWVGREVKQSVRPKRPDLREVFKVI